MASLPNEDFLLEILKQPTVPFREMHVKRVISEKLKAEAVPFFEDPAGNLIVGVGSRLEYLKQTKLKTDSPLRIYIAHLDHPGFHGEAWRGERELEVKFHGGAPVQHLDGADVWLGDSQGWLGRGRMKQPKLLPSGKSLDTAVIEVEGSLDRKHSDARKIFGAFRFREPVWREGDIYYTKAADDLVGAFAICQLAIETYKGASKKKNSKPVPFIGLLSRAEEVGFVGAVEHFNLGWLKGARRKTVAVSLETSRMLPGAEIGKGPVVRLGDRASIFSSGPTQLLTEIAAKTLPEKHQRRIMDGGTCEGTAALAYGMEVVALSVPLGNYHNQSFEGGPDSRGPGGPAPEFVHRDDVIGLLELCRGLIKAKVNWHDPLELKRLDYAKNAKKYARLMREGLKL